MEEMQDYLISCLNSCKKRYASRVEDMCNQFHQSMDGLLEEMVRDVLIDFTSKFGNNCSEAQTRHFPILEEAAAMLEITESVQTGDQVNYYTVENNVSPNDNVIKPTDDDDEVTEVTIVKEELHEEAVCPDLKIAPSTATEISIPAAPTVQLSYEAAKLIWKVSNECYRCRQCWREFRVRRYAEQHVRTHTGERPYACHLCGRPFTQRSTMYRHLREAHFRMKHSECPVCHKTFSRELTMKKHMLTHAREELNL